MTVGSFYNSNKHPMALHQHLFGESFIGQLDFWTAEELVGFGQELLLTPNSHLLDIGSGWAGPACLLAGRFGCRVTAVEFSETNLKRAQERVSQTGLDGKVQLVHGCVLEQSFERETFDCAMAVDSIVHISGADQLFQRVAEWLRPSGRILLATEVVPSECPAPLRRLREELGAVRCASREQYIHWLEVAGFDIIEDRAYPELRQTIATRALRWMHETGDDEGAPSMQALYRIAVEGRAVERVLVATKRPAR